MDAYKKLERQLGGTYTTIYRAEINFSQKKHLLPIYYLRLSETEEKDRANSDMTTKCPI